MITYSLVEKPTLERAQALVGGYVELLELPSNYQMLVNEEGLLKGLSLNPAASIIAGQPIVGNAILLAPTARWD